MVPVGVVPFRPLIHLPRLYQLLRRFPKATHHHIHTPPPHPPQQPFAVPVIVSSASSIHTPLSLSPLLHLQVAVAQQTKALAIHQQLGGFDTPDGERLASPAAVHCRMLTRW